MNLPETLKAAQAAVDELGGAINVLSHLVQPKPSSWFRNCIREAMDSGHDVKFHWGAYGTLTAKFYAGDTFVHEREWALGEWER